MAAFKLLFSAGIIAWLIWSGKFDFSALSQLLKPMPLVICTGLSLVNLLLCNERWLSLLQEKNIRISRINAWRLTTIGTFFNFVVPGGVGGDVIKGYYIARENPSERLVSVVSVALDRLIGLYTMVIMALVVMISNFKQVTVHKELEYVFMILLALCLGFSVFWGLVFSQRISSASWLQTILKKLPYGHKLWVILEAFSAYSKNKNIFFKTILISFVAQCFSIGLFIVIANLLGYTQISFSTYFFIVPIGFMVTAIPVSPAGIGIGQAAFFYLFNIALGKETPLGSTAITAFQCLQFLISLFGAWYYVTMKKQLAMPVAENSRI